MELTKNTSFDGQLFDKLEKKNIVNQLTAE